MLHEISTEDGKGATGACYVMVTSDQQRTMATHLGVSGLLGVEHIDDDLLSRGAICYFDGYLLDFPGARAIVEALIRSAERNNTALARSVSLTPLSSSAIVMRSSSSFLTSAFCFQIRTRSAA